MYPNAGQQPPQTPPTTASGANSISVSGQGNNVTGYGNINNTVNNNSLAPQTKKGISFDTKMLLAVLLFDVVFFFYGMWSYTGKNTNVETWRAIIMLVMAGVTVGMIRRWFRRRT